MATPWRGGLNSKRSLAWGVFFVFLGGPNKAESIKPRYVLVGQLLPLAVAGIFTRVPRLGAELGEEFVFGNRNVGVAMRLLVLLQVLYSIVECLGCSLHHDRQLGRHRRG